MIYYCYLTLLGENLTKETITMMNEKEWAEFFELTQGRKPLPEDYQKAASAGEFKPETTVQATEQAKAQEIPNQAIPEQTAAPQTQASTPLQTQPANQAINTGVATPNAPAGTTNPTAPLVQGQPLAAASVARQANKTSAFKKMGQVFKKKGGKKGWPLWLNIGIMVLIALALLGAGFWGHHSQRQLTTKLANGDWELKESAYYKDGDWDTYYENGNFKDDKDTRAGSDSSEVTFKYYLSNKDGNFVLYNYFDASSDSVSFSSYEHPTRTLTVNKQKQTASHRTDDDYAYLYSPSKPEKSESLDDYKVRYFRKGDELIFVYYDGSKPYYRETYRSMSTSQAKTVRSKVQKSYKNLEDYVKEQYDDGDDNSSSNSGTSGFQAG